MIMDPYVLTVIPGITGKSKASSLMLDPCITKAMSKKPPQKKGKTGKQFKEKLIKLS